MSKLKPCPFCGEKATLDYSVMPNRKHWFITCDCCGMMYQYTLSQRKYVKDGWNTRPIEDALTARIAELEMKIRHNALWQASVDAEERAHLEKLVPDLKKRIADLEARAEKAEAMVEKLNSWVEKLMDVGWGMWRESNFGGHETLNEIRWEQLANIISKERER